MRLMGRAARDLDSLQARRINGVLKKSEWFLGIGR